MRPSAAPTLDDSLERHHSAARHSLSHHPAAMSTAHVEKAPSPPTFVPPPSSTSAAAPSTSRSASAHAPGPSQSRSPPRRSSASDSSSLASRRTRLSRESAASTSTAQQHPPPPSSSRIAEGRFMGLRRSRSNMKLFGGAPAQRQSEGVKPDLSLATSSARSSLPLTTASNSSDPSLTSSPRQPNVANKIGGWLSHMLNSPSSSLSSRTSLDAATEDKPTTSQQPSTTSDSPTRQSDPVTESRHNGSWIIAGDSTRPSSTPKSSPSVKASPSKRLTPLLSTPSARGRFDHSFFERAQQFLFDSDAKPTRCTDDIWLLGSRHPGYTPPDNGSADEVFGAREPDSWPASFYADFYSRVALTYRAGFPAIPCAPSSGFQSMLSTLNLSIGRAGSGRTTEGLTSDTGWGCMLRTGQSLLANALVRIHLGRDWRRPLPGTQTFDERDSLTATERESMARYIRLLTLFCDDPAAPFSVHRFAIMGKELGKEVGEWFGPSTAAGAIRALVGRYEPAGLAVANFVDGSIYKSVVEAEASVRTDGSWSRPVLVLVGLRLGIDNFNPLYHDGVKSIFEMPQTVGIAGGRPSSSYYFVGAQDQSLFYIDPHHPKPAVPLAQLPAALADLANRMPLSGAPDALLEHVREQLDDFFLDAYPDPTLRSFHCERVRRMALASMDPSMLVGFLIRDESDWVDFVARHKSGLQHHRAVFSVADAQPAWMRGRQASSFMASPSPTSPEQLGDGESVEEEPDVQSLSSSSDSEGDDGNEWREGAAMSPSLSRATITAPPRASASSFEDVDPITRSRRDSLDGYVDADISLLSSTPSSGLERLMPASTPSKTSPEGSPRPPSDRVSSLRRPSLADSPTGRESSMVIVPTAADARLDEEDWEGIEKT